MSIRTSRRAFLSQGGAAAAGTLLSTSVVGTLGALAAPATRAQQASTAADASVAGKFLIGGQFPVNRLGFGAMRVTGDGIWGEPDNRKEALAVLKRAVELGTNFIDTADAYGPFVSELLICEALYPDPRGLRIATKGGQTRPSRQEWVPNGRPKHLREACEASLARLKVDSIDLYQLHRPDPQVPYEDSVGELAKLQKEGKIRYVGVSNVSVEQLAKARAIVKVVSVQNQYNVSDRSSDDVLAFCEREKIAFIPWGPLAQRAQQNSTPPKPLLALQAIATKRNIDINEAALAWLLARSPVMLPIPGTSKVAHLEDNVGAAAIHLTPQEMAQVG
jgi:pyridoxine 4-dehydrogenase